MERDTDRKHISVHIEKTAGSSLEDFLVRFYGRENVLIYSANTEKVFPSGNIVMFLRFNPIVDKLKSSKIGSASLPIAHKMALYLLKFQGGQKDSNGETILPKSWQVIHGHFKADKFDLKVANPFRTIILREPLERTMSHYKYWKKAKGVLNHRINIPYQENMHFRDYALLTEQQNFQSNSFGSVDLKDFDVVGVTEKFGDFLLDLIKKRGRQDFVLTKIPRLNESKWSSSFKEFDIDDNFVKKFKSINELDYENWQKASER